MAGTTLIPAALRIGTAAQKPTAASVPDSFFYATDTHELSVSDGVTWTVVNATSAHPTTHATGVMTVAAGTTSQSAAHGLAGIPLVSIEPLDDTLGARHRMTVDATNVSVLIDHSVSTDVRFYWMGVFF